LTYKAEQLGYHSQVILAGRRINDDMGKYVVENLIKRLIQSDVLIRNARVAILGFTFKENCPDTRNTRVIDIVNELKEYGVIPMIADPAGDAVEAKHEYGIAFNKIEEIVNMDAVILAVAHDEFLRFKMADIEKFYNPGPNSKKVLLDIKGLLNRNDYEAAGYQYWRL
jgi:UDP-N-acetyl-D-galactosamine dehydrogenase